MQRPTSPHALSTPLPAGTGSAVSYLTSLPPLLAPKWLSKMALVAAVSTLLSHSSPSAIGHGSLVFPSVARHDSVSSFGFVDGREGGRVRARHQRGEEDDAEGEGEKAEEGPEGAAAAHAARVWDMVSCCARSSRGKKQEIRAEGAGEWAEDDNDDNDADNDADDNCDTDSLAELVLSDDHDHGRRVGVRQIGGDERGAGLAGQCDEGTKAGFLPERIGDGVSGAYVLKDRHGVPAAVFKPAEEEVGCAKNPKGHMRSASGVKGGAGRAGIAPGEGMLREVAASVLDHDHFVGVPATCLVESSGLDDDDAPMKGSLQAFVPSDGPSGDFGWSAFPVRDVQRIAVFDMRVLNLDRHDGNLLLVSNATGSPNLVPIDHGYCLPTQLCVDGFDWCWLSWPQLQQPVQPDVAAHILALDADDDLARLAAAGITLPPAACALLHITTAFLKAALRGGLSLRDMARCMARLDEDVPAPLEAVVAGVKTVDDVVAEFRASMQ